MCEMLIRVVDKLHDTDPYVDCKLMKRGDVVTVQPDGWNWSIPERTTTFWRILCIPSMSVEDAAGFVAPELDTDPSQPSRMLQPRAFTLDLDAVAAMSPEAQVWLDDDGRAAPTFTTNLNLIDALALKVAKPPYPDPNILG